MATLAQIREGIAANLTKVYGRNSAQVSAYMLSNPSPPAFEVYPDTLAYDKGVRTDEYRLKVRAIVAFNTDLAAQQLLDSFLAASGGVKEAIEAEPTLAGAVDDLRVEDASGYRLYDTDSGRALGCEWTVCVITTR